MAAETLVEILDAAVAQRSSHPAVVDPGVGEISYGELAALAGQLETRLRRLGVGRGDRVGLCLSKSIDAVAGIWGILRTGAAYVPIDADAPAWRGAYILNDCSVKAVLLERRLADSLGAELERLGPRPAFLELPGVGGGDGLRGLLGQEPAGSAAGAGSGERPDPDDLAYILYTSGSTGKPKGVMLTHRNALSFVAWCSDTFQPRPEDRFASHAPFHFDLSILDLYVSFRHGATLVLVGSDTGKQPLALADLLAESAISIWYSAPSILGMLAQFGKLERHRYPALRMVLFAGEVFPVKHLRALKAQLPGPRYFNLYGPTETNVCTWFEIPAVVPEERTTPYPIGKVCPQLRGRVLDQAGQAVPAGGGVAGELCIAGPNVMQGYWNLPERTAEAFLVDGSGARWYRTGDLVVEEEDGNLLFGGRRDRMVKRRGYRIELAEIEAGLHRNAAVEEAAVVAHADPAAGVRITAFLTVGGGERPSLIALKRFCAEQLPDFMMPDRFVVLDALPRTSTDKTDYQRLLEMT